MYGQVGGARAQTRLGSSWVAPLACAEGFRDYRVVLLSSATATFDYPDVGQDGMSAAEVHRATPVILVGSTAHVMTAEEFMAHDS